MKNFNWKLQWNPRLNKTRDKKIIREENRTEKGEEEDPKNEQIKSSRSISQLLDEVVQLGQK